MNRIQITQVNEVKIENHMHLDGRYILPLVNATREFLKTKQNILNFNVTISDEEEENGIVRIGFWGKPIPGKRTIGGRNENGYAINYFVDMNTGKIVKTSFAR